MEVLRDVMELLPPKAQQIVSIDPSHLFRVWPPHVQRFQNAPLPFRQLRSEYFRAMFRGGWAESAGLGPVGKSGVGLGIGIFRVAVFCCSGHGSLTANKGEELRVRGKFNVAWWFEEG